MQVAFTKHSYAKNSRIEVELVDQDVGPWWHELGCPDVHKALVSTWEKAKVPIPVELARPQERVSRFTRSSERPPGDS
jgi:hypothetical protein